VPYDLSLRYHAHRRHRTVVLDVYLTRDHARVFLVDINPFAPRTDPLLYTWPELLALPFAPARPLLRLVRSQVEASQQRPRYAAHRLPRDVIDLSDGRSIAEFAEEWRNALQEASTVEAEVARPSSAELAGR
jgi:hypothetical protein